MPFSRSPFLSLAACFALGIVLARAGGAFSSISFLLVSASVCLLAGLLLLRRVSPATVGLVLVNAPKRISAADIEAAQTNTRSANWPRLVCGFMALAGFIFAGAASSLLFELRFPPYHASHLQSFGLDLRNPVWLEGKLISSPARASGGNLQFDLAASAVSQSKGPRQERRPLTGKFRLWMRSPSDAESFAALDALQLRYGDGVRARLELRRPRVYRNPGGFDYRHWLESYIDVCWEGSIASAAQVQKLAPLSDSRRSWIESVARLISRVRQHLLQTIDRLYPPWTVEGRDGAVLKAVLLGDRSALDSDVIERFRKAGLYHLLVIAGLHVGLLAFLLTSLLRRMRVRESWRAAVVLVMLLVYASLVEQRAPTLRATLMISAYLIARLLGREQAALNAIGLAALVLLVTRPAWLFEAGFQLSFAAALLIAGVAVPVLARTTEPYRRALSRLDDVDLDTAIQPKAAQFRITLRSIISVLQGTPFLRDHSTVAKLLVISPAGVAIWAAEMLLFSAVLQLGLLLPMAETFHRVSLAGVGLNALAIPVMTVLLVFSIPTVLVGTASIELAAIPARALHLVMQGLFALTDLPHLPRLLSFRVPEPPVWVAWGFALALVAAGFLLARPGNGWERYLLGSALVVAAILGLLIVLDPFPPKLPRGELEITALDCGDGQALFVVLPDSKTILIDAGGGRTTARSLFGAFRLRRWDPGEEIVSPYLWRRGVKRLDSLVLAGARLEHLGGLEAILDNFAVGELWFAAAVKSTMSEEHAHLFETARRHGVLLRELASGDSITSGASRMRVLWPPRSLPDPDPGALGSRARNAWLNTNSLVLHISSGHASLLLPGDTTEKVQQQLAESAQDLGSLVLALARRGADSALSRDFLHSVAPRIAIGSAPSEAEGDSGFKQQLMQAGVRVYRTDLEGAVTVEMNGSAVKVHCYADRLCR